MRTLLFFAFVACSSAQIKIDTKIIGVDVPLDQETLNTELTGNSVPAALTVVSESGSQIVIQECAMGTYAEGSATSCVDCSAGSASAMLGAKTQLACQTCSAGAFSSQAASQCTLCSVGKFSPIAGATADAQCKGCPTNSNSTVGTDSVTKCACNDKYFLPANLMQPLDPKAPAQFASWAALAISVMLVDVPHVSC